MQTKKSLLFLVLTLFIILPTSTTFRLKCTRTRKSEEIKINCTFIQTIEYGNLVGRVKRCEADRSITSTNHRTSVIEVHQRSICLTPSNLSDINGLWIDQADVKFIPTGIKKKIPNIKALSIMGSGLLAVQMSDFFLFREKLEYVDLQKNAIRFLDEDLFVYNTNLKVANFWDNPIGYIEPNFFANLKSLTKLMELNLRRTCMKKNVLVSEIISGDFKMDNGTCNDIAIKSLTVSGLKKLYCLSETTTESIICQ